MRIVLWLGNESNQKGLANKIGKEADIVGIVTESRIGKRKITPGKLVEKLVEKFLLRNISRSWSGMKSFYQDKYPNWPDTPVLDAVNINSDEVFEFTKALNPDLIVVSGTSLIRKKLLAINPSIGIINLHTGLSPYIKGGPNCTNWCISTKQFELIGNTIMWIDAGIDTGSIIATELTSMTGDESLTEVHLKVMEHAHDLYVRSIKKLAITKKPGVNQHAISKGKTYYSKQWGLKEKINLIINFRKFRQERKSDSYKSKQAAISLVDL